MENIDDLGIRPFVLSAGGCSREALALGGGYPQENAQSDLLKIILVIAVIVVPIGGFILFRSFKNKDGEAPRVSAPPKAASFPSTPGYPRGSVFISYRRDDSADVTGRIHERLWQRFAKDVVFKDFDSAGN
jgi:hypothetical protein